MSRTRTTRTVLLSLGSNVEPEKNIIRVLDRLDELLGIESASPVYSADPVGNPGPQFLNGAVRMTSSLDPWQLKFDIFRPLEAELGRIRTSDPGAPRTIDIDLSIVEGLIVDRPGLQLPDPETLTRAHVALPLADVAPDFVHPVAGVPLREVAAHFHGEGGLRLLPSLNWPSR